MKAKLEVEQEFTKDTIDALVEYGYTTKEEQEEQLKELLLDDLQIKAEDFLNGDNSVVELDKEIDLTHQELVTLADKIEESAEELATNPLSLRMLSNSFKNYAKTLRAIAKNVP